MAETTSAEFEMWKVYLEEDLNIHGKQDYYMASIVCKIHECFSGKGSKKVKLEQFLLKFKRSKAKKVVVKKQTVEEASKISKSIWKRIVGL